MANLNGKHLADGQLANTSTALFTNGAAPIVHVTDFYAFNTGASSQTVILIANQSGSDRKMRQWVLAQNESAEWHGHVALENGDILKAQTTTATQVDYVADGYIES